MSFRHIAGNAKVETYPNAISTVYTAGGLGYFNGSGAVIPADATSGDHAGVILEAIAATDAKYSTAGKIPVLVPDQNDIFEVDVETGTLTTAMIGNQYDLVADGDAIDVTATSKKVVTVVGFVSSSKALVKINALATTANVATT
jgi:hypothetical protein